VTATPRDDRRPPAWQGPGDGRGAERAPVEVPEEAWPSPLEEASLSAFFARLLPALRAFRYPHYRILWVSGVLSSVGNWMQTAAYGVLVLGLTGSPLLTALIPASQQFLMGPLGPVGGLLADRFNRRNLLIVTQSAFAISAAGIAVLILMGDPRPAPLLAISLATGVFMAVNFPAYQAFFPRLIPPGEMPNAVAMNSVSFNVARIVGPSIGAVILRIWGPGPVFLVNAATFVLFAVALMFIPSRTGAIPAAHRDAVGSIGDGWRYVRRDPTTRTLIMGIGLISLFALPVIWLSPLMADRIFGSPRDTGFILSAMGGGAIFGALLAGSLGADRRPHIGTVSYFLLALSLGGFAFATVPALSLALIALFGASYMGAAVVINSLVQLVTPDRIRGRVMSLYMMAWVGLLPYGAILAGGLAEWVGGDLGAPLALAVGAGLCLLFAIRLAVRGDWIPRNPEAADGPGPASD